MTINNVIANFDVTAYAVFCVNHPSTIIIHYHLSLPSWLLLLTLALITINPGFVPTT